MDSNESYNKYTAINRNPVLSSPYNLFLVAMHLAVHVFTGARIAFVSSALSTQLAEWWTLSRDRKWKWRFGHQSAARRDLFIFTIALM